MHRRREARVPPSRLRDRALRPLLRLADQLGRRGDDADAGRVVVRAGAEVPRVEVRTQQNTLIQVFAAIELANHVIGSRFPVETHIEVEANAIVRPR